jgi:antitoxin HicB
MEYPVILTRDTNGTVLVDFPDFPEAHTFGDTIEEALAHAPDALATVIDGYVKDRRLIPLPSSNATKYHVTMPALVEAKVALYETMQTGKIKKAELARRLDWHLPQVDRLLEMTHASKLDQIESAFRVMGKQMTIRISDASEPIVVGRRAAQRGVRPAAKRRAARGRRGASR